MRVSKAKNQKIANPVKVTFQAQSTITQLIKQYIPMRATIQKLLNKTLKKTYSVNEILTICKKMPKSLERSINIQNQLDLCKEIKEIADNFLEPSTKHHFKAYTLYISFQHFSEILTSRLLYGIKGHFEDIENNPEVLKLFYFTKELEDINIFLQEWAKVRTTQNSFHHPRRPISFVFHGEKQINGKNNVLTRPSTAQMSRNFSRHQKRVTLQDFNQRSSEYLLFRSSTAKLERKQVKLAIRCPSAAEILKKSLFKQPSFEMKRSYKRLKHKSNDCQLVSKTHLKQNTKVFNTSKNSIGEIQCESLTNDNYKNDSKQALSKKYRKVSILNKSLKDKQQELEHEIRFKQTRKLKNYEHNKSKNTAFEAHLKKKKRPIYSEEDQQNEQSGKQSEEQEEEERDIATPLITSDAEIDEEHMNERKMDKKMSRTSNFKKSQLISQYQSETSLQFKVNSEKGLNDNEQSVRVNEKKPKKVRRPGKMMRKSRDQINYVNMLNIPKKATHFYQRRKAIMTNQNEQDQLKKELQILQLNIQNSANQAANQKQMNFEEDVLLAVQDALKNPPKPVPKINLQKDKKIINTITVNNLYGQMNQFLKDYQSGSTTQQPLSSVFFDQQEQARQLQDQSIRQKMQQMMKHNQNSMSSIFELYCREVNNRDEMYNQIHRHLSFSSDTEWIRHAYSSHPKLIQKQI